MYSLVWKQARWNVEETFKNNFVKTSICSAESQMKFSLY